MAINITFWWLSEDEKEFLNFIEKEGRVIALPLENSAPVKEDLVCSPSQLIDRENCSQMFLTLKPLLAEVVYVQYEMNGKTLFGIDAVNSPVISYSRSVFREENILGQAAISAHLEKLTDDKKKLVQKNDEFISWTKSVFSYVRKSTPEWHEYKTYRITKRVTEAVRNGLKLIF